MKNNFRGMKFSVLLFCMLFVTIVKAQRIEDVVYLKNGSIIRGQLQPSADKAKIRIETTCRSIWVFDTLEISKLTEEPFFVRTYREKGIEIHANMGTYGLDVRDDKVAFGGDLTVGYLNKYRIYTGIGAGIEQNVEMLYPLYANLKCIFFDKQRSPFFTVRYGYGFMDSKHSKSDQSYKGGQLFSIALGFRKDFPDEVATTISFGYRFQHIEYHEKYSWRQDFLQVTKYDLNRFEVRVALVF